MRTILIGLLLTTAALAEDQPEKQAGIYTCADVHWAKANLPEATIELIKARMTPEQLAQARRCLLHRVKITK